MYKAMTQPLVQELTVGMDNPRNWKKTGQLPERKYSPKSRLLQVSEKSMDLCHFV